MPAGRTAPTDSTAAGPPDSLLTRLQAFSLSGNVPRDGVLLVVDPQTASPPAQVVGQPPLNTDAAASLAEAAKEFGRRVATFGGVTALVPEKMVLLNPDPGPPNPYVGLDRASKVHLLTTTLTPQQWQRLGSPTGLGVEDVSDEQRALFLSLLPEPFRLDRATAAEGGQYKIDAGVQTLSAGERLQVHLRLSLATEVLALPSAAGQGVTLVGGPVLRPPGTSLLVLGDVPDAVQFAASYGVPLRAEVPNQPKPGSLSFSAPALSVSVPLTGPLTVGELVHRAGLASGLELYADKRIAPLAVWVRGTTAPAADLLRAVCLSICGTFRQVGPAFVLTDDVLGVGTRTASLDDWLSDAAAQREQVVEAVRRRPVAQPLLSSLSLSSGDMLAKDSATRDKVIQSYNTSYNGAGWEVPITALSAAEQSEASRYVQNALGQGQPVRTDRVALDIKLRMGYAVPGVGEIGDFAPDLGSLVEYVQMPMPGSAASAPQPLSELSRFKSRILYIAPTGAEEVKRVIAAAKELGVGQLWVRIPAGGDTSLLRSAVGLGLENHLTVFGVVSLLRQPAGGPGADLNIQGKPSSAYDAVRRKSPAARSSRTSLALKSSDTEWLRPDAEFFEADRKTINSLGRLAALAGIVITDTAAPGYEQPRPLSQNDPLGMQAAITRPGDAAEEMGYTEELRLAFLRQYGVDPVDLAPSVPRPGVDLSLPFFPAAAGDSQRWAEFRYKQNARSLAASRGVVNQAFPNRPLLISERSGSDLWFGSWDKATALPVHDPAGPPLLQQAQTYSSRVFLNVRLTDDSISAADCRQYLKGVIHSGGQADRWSGMVFDVTRVPLDKALALLRPCLGAPQH